MGRGPWVLLLPVRSIPLPPHPKEKKWRSTYNTGVYWELVKSTLSEIVKAPPTLPPSICDSLIMTLILLQSLTSQLVLTIVQILGNPLHMAHLDAIHIILESISYNFKIRFHCVKYSKVHCISYWYNIANGWHIHT